MKKFFTVFVLVLGGLAAILVVSAMLFGDPAGNVNSPSPEIAAQPAQSAAQILQPAPVAESPDAPAPKMGKPRKVATWTGSGNKKTQSFEIASARYRVHYSVTPDAEAKKYKMPGVLTIGAQRSGGGEFDSEQLASESAGSSTQSDSYGTGPGKFYLDINSSSAKWKIEVFDGE